MEADRSMAGDRKPQPGSILGHADRRLARLPGCAHLRNHGLWHSLECWGCLRARTSRLDTGHCSTLLARSASRMRSWANRAGSPPKSCRSSADIQLMPMACSTLLVPCGSTQRKCGTWENHLQYSGKSWHHECLDRCYIMAPWLSRCWPRNSTSHHHLLK